MYILFFLVVFVSVSILWVRVCVRGSKRHCDTLLWKIARASVIDRGMKIDEEIKTDRAEERISKRDTQNERVVERDRDINAESLEEREIKRKRHKARDRKETGRAHRERVRACVCMYMYVHLCSRVCVLSCVHMPERNRQTL